MDEILIHRERLIITESENGKLSLLTVVCVVACNKMWCGQQ